MWQKPARQQSLIPGTGGKAYHKWNKRVNILPEKNGAHDSYNIPFQYRSTIHNSHCTLRRMPAMEFYPPSRTHSRLDYACRRYRVRGKGLSLNFSLFNTLYSYIMCMGSFVQYFVLVYDVHMGSPPRQPAPKPLYLLRAKINRTKNKARSPAMPMHFVQHNKPLP